MKKLITAALLLLSLSAISQTSYHVYKSQIGRWNDYTKKWSYERAEYVNMDIITTKGTIYITDQARSSYEIISDEGDYKD